MNYNGKFYKNWEHLLNNSVITEKQFLKYFNNKDLFLSSVIKKYPMFINPYYLSLIVKKNDPLWLQAVPSVSELNNCEYTSDDPLNENLQSPVVNIIHRYPARVIFLVSNRCAMYCRFCMRKRRIGLESAVTGKTIETGLRYISKNNSINEVILSGGDPLLLKDDCLEMILDRISHISHVKVIRIHSRVLCTLPHRITKNLVSVLKRYQPLYIITHFNHIFEITREAETACNLVTDAGIFLGNQTVLLKNINDDPVIMKKLLERLIEIRVKPYYLHHMDQIRGTAHFKTSINTGLDIMKFLRGNISGICLPHYMLDLPSGGGKIPLTPQYIKKITDKEMVIHNYKGEVYTYRENRAVKS